MKKYFVHVECKVRKMSYPS